MDAITRLISSISEKLTGMARGNAVVARTVSVGDRHVLPLCELAVGFGGGGGEGQGTDGSGNQGFGKGTGGAAAGMAKAAPVAVIIVDGTSVRVESLNR